METIDSILSKSEKGTRTKLLIGRDLFGVPFSVLDGTIITGVTVPYSDKGVQLNFGAVTNHGFVYGIVDRSARKFYPGRILSDKTDAASFIPGLDFKGRFIPGAAREEVFVPGVYYMGTFIPGIYRGDVFVPGSVKTHGFEELPDPSDIGGMLEFGNPFNWDLSEGIPAEDRRPPWEKEPDKTWKESAVEGITNRFKIPVGYGNGSKPSPGKLHPEPGGTLPGHSESIVMERERESYDMLDFDKDGKANFGWRFRDPRISPSEPGESETFSYGIIGEKDDFNIIGESVGVGMGSKGGGINIPKVTGDPEEDAKNILGGINPNKRNRIWIGDPGPEADPLTIFFLGSAAFMAIGLGIYVGVTYEDEIMDIIDPDGPDESKSPPE